MGSMSSFLYFNSGKSPFVSMQINEFSLKTTIKDWNSKTVSYEGQMSID